MNLNDLFVQLGSYVIYSMCHAEIFEQIKMDGWIDGWMEVEILSSPEHALDYFLNLFQINKEVR